MLFYEFYYQLYKCITTFFYCIIFLIEIPMTKTAVVIATALTLFAALYSVNQPTLAVEMPEIVAPWSAEQCTEKLEIECAIEVERTVRACAAAFETEGSDIIADIKCARDLLADKKYCWPCICAEAKKKGWHVVGC